LEDNLYLPNGEMAKSNGELVEVAARMVRDVGRKVATVEEAKKILQLDEVRARAKSVPAQVVATA
ncbi:MAG: 3-keto-5-aminohexanoate cleavage protein, partial [Polyangiaceae bacterium]